MRTLTRSTRTRRIAAAMLFVWLFAVAASWAHACLLREPAAAADEHHHPPEAAQELCASFCDAEQRTVAKPQPTPGDDAGLAAAPAPAAELGWPVFTPGLALPRWRPLAAPPPPGPPVAIVFLRLTR